MEPQTIHRTIAIQPCVTDSSVWSVWSFTISELTEVQSLEIEFERCVIDDWHTGISDHCSETWSWSVLRNVLLKRSHRVSVFINAYLLQFQLKCVVLWIFWYMIPQNLKQEFVDNCIYRICSRMCFRSFRHFNCLDNTALAQFINIVVNCWER